MSANIERELKDIRDRLDVLITLCRNILNILISEKSPTQVEISAIETKDELIPEREFIKVLEG